MFRCLVLLFGLVGPALVLGADQPPQLWTASTPCTPAHCPITQFQKKLLASTPPGQVLLAELPGPDDLKPSLVSLVPIVMDGPATPSTVWHASISGVPLSNVTIVSTGPDRIVGLISAGTGHTYRLSATAGSATLERATAVVPTTDASSQGDCGDRAEHVPRAYCKVGATAARVSVLVVYTEAAAGRLGDEPTLKGWVTLAVARLNLAFLQGAIDHRVEIAGIEKVHDYSSISHLGDTFRRLVAGTDGLDQVHVMRRNLKADIVVMIDEPEKGIAAACQLLQSTRGPTYLGVAPFAILSTGALTGPDILAHEVGHVLGAGHWDGPGLHRSSRAFIDLREEQSVSWQSLMQRDDACPDCAMPLYWSNPRIGNFDGSPLGNAFTADNAATLNDTMCTVERFGDRLR